MNSFSLDNKKALSHASVPFYGLFLVVGFLAGPSLSLDSLTFTSYMEYYFTMSTSVLDGGLTYAMMAVAFLGFVVYRYSDSLYAQVKTAIDKGFTKYSASSVVAQRASVEQAFLCSGIFAGACGALVLSVAVFNVIPGIIIGWRELEGYSVVFDWSTAIAVLGAAIMGIFHLDRVEPKEVFDNPRQLWYHRTSEWVNAQLASPGLDHAEYRTIMEKLLVNTLEREAEAQARRASSS